MPPLVSTPSKDYKLNHSAFSFLRQSRQKMFCILPQGRLFSLHKWCRIRHKLNRRAFHLYKSMSEKFDHGLYHNIISRENFCTRTPSMKFVDEQFEQVSLSPLSF